MSSESPSRSRCTMQLPGWLNLPPSFPILWQHDDNQYETSRIGRVFNRRTIPRFPKAVVKPTTEGQIVEAVRLANTLGCRISVRSGGHSWAAWSVRDGAILIDLGDYHELDLDEKTHILKVSPSTTGQTVNMYLQTHGRMFPGGHCPGVGLGGFLLQGGMGWNCKNWGWACERLVALDVVTADGRQLHCNEAQNSELLWAARGAGPGFPAIVTRFYLQTMPAITHMRSAAFTYKREDARTALEWAIGISPAFDASTEIVAVASYPPRLDDVHVTVLFVTFKNSEAEAQAALEPAQDSAPAGYVDSWFSKETSLADEYNDQSAANPEGHRYCVDNCYVRNDADVVSVLLDAFTSLPSRKSFSLWYSMAPCSRRKASDGTMPDMALSMQSDHYFAVYSIWEDESDDARCTEWVKDIFKKVERHSEGAYLGDSDFQVRKTRFWGTEQGHKLMDIRRRWDPNGVVAGYLDVNDQSGVKGLNNLHEWAT